MLRQFNRRNTLSQKNVIYLQSISLYILNFVTFTSMFCKLNVILISTWNV